MRACFAAFVLGIPCDSVHLSGARSCYACFGFAVGAFGLDDLMLCAHVVRAAAVALLAAYLLPAARPCPLVARSYVRDVAGCAAAARLTAFDGRRVGYLHQLLCFVPVCCPCRAPLT